MCPLLRRLQCASTHLCQLTALRADYTLRYLILCILLTTEDLSRAYEGKTYTGLDFCHGISWHGRPSDMQTGADIRALHTYSG